MSDGTDVYCSTCFAVPGEMCRTKYLVHGNNEVTPVVCPTHMTRLVDSQNRSITLSRKNLAIVIARAATPRRL
jgi:hypothetical protein